MLILNKYKSTLHINFIYLDQVIIDNRKKNKIIKYTFTHKLKLVRNLIFLYSIFLISNVFSCCVQKNNPEFKINIKLFSILLLNNDYTYFFKN